jgi:RNA polymerase sigma factor (TIGR02999 family)
LDELMPLVYPQMREIAAACMRREPNPDVWQPTVLVHELYLRLLGQRRAEWNNRRHFFVFSARMMRMILVDHARGNLAKTRGGNCRRIPLSDELTWIPIGSPELLDLNYLLDELNAREPAKAQMVELRYFLGCTAEETAALMRVSKATVDRELRYLKGWFYKRMRPSAPARASVT